MRHLQSFLALSLITSVGLLNAASAQPGVATGSDGLNSPPISNPAVPVAAPAAPVGSTVASAASAPVSINPSAAVKSVLTMFYIDSTVNVESSGKPLPSSGSWGAQTQFPGGVPQPCVKARIPCVRVVYRVTELNVVCEWTLGMVGVALPQSDGTIARATRSLVLDENDAAAHYTVRKAWSQGEAMPRPTQVQNPAYPKIAVDAKVGGVVAVRLIVGPDGSIKSVVPIAGPAMLQVAVVEAVRHWKFDPLSIGQQPTSFQLDEQFAYNAPKANTFAGMDPSGRVMLPTTDAHQDPGFHADGASSGQWAACSAVTCTHAAPDVPPSK